MSAMGSVVTAPNEMPHDDHAERSVLGSIFVKPASWFEVSELHTDEFMLPGHREIWDAVTAIAKRGGPHGDVVAVADEMGPALKKLNGGLMYLSGLANDVPTAENVRHYADIVRGKATQRRVIATCAEIASTARGAVHSVTEMLAEARSKFTAIELHGTSATRWMGDDYERVVAQMEQRGVRAADPVGRVVSTGLLKLDTMIGPLRPDNLVAIGANPGRGKSALAWNIALHNAKRGIPVLVFSMEMSRAQLIERAIAYDLKINGRHVSTGKLDKEQWYRVDRSALKTLPVWINDERMTIAKLQGEVRAWRAKRRRERLAKGMSAEDAELALVVVDYLQLIDVEQSDQRKRYEAVGAVSRELKLLTKERDANCPIIECVQLNRANVKEGTKDGKPREPKVQDMRESGNIEMDADMILFPWWDTDPPNTGNHDAVILVAKQRSGVPGRVRVTWQPAFTTFTDRVGDPDGRMPAEPDDSQPDTR